MQRVDTLIKKLQEQLEAQLPVNQLLLTVQMLEAELQHLKKNTNAESNSMGDIAIHHNILPAQKKPAEEKTIEILQVDEAAIEAELAEIKRNAAAIQKISGQSKPNIAFDEEEHIIPTLAHHLTKGTPAKEVNESIATAGASLNDKLKQTKIDLGDTLTEAPIRDLRKAIGVNDRFLYINELFRGDETMYERSIKTINGFSILPEAEYWIQRELKVKLAWSDDNETVQQFTQLVKRRFT